MSPNDPTSEPMGEARIDMGVNGFGCAIRALEFGSEEAARSDTLGQVMRLYQGSVSECVLHHSTCTTTVVR